jgi:DNA-nicking Smr family endonuclease
MRGRSKRETPPVPKPVAVPEKLARPFAESMKAMKAEMEAEETREREARAAAGSAPKRPAAVPPSVRTPPRQTVDRMGHYDYDDRAAFHQAYGDVRPIAKAKAPRRSGQTSAISETEKRERALVAERAQQAEDAARARLDALVAGSVRFVIERENDGGIYGRRDDASPRMLDTITGPKVAPTARLDLHGRDAAGATREVVRHVREESARGARVLLIVHGKGLHSEGGVGVLADVVVKALTESAIAPRVLAFATAAPRLGGHGAMVVRLTGA